MSGDATPAQIGGFLMALRVRGETVDEITGGAAGAARRRMIESRRRPSAIDTCGTGGDASGTFNISTAARAGRRRPAACRSPSTATARCRRRSGAADVLAALGVNIDADMALVERAMP